MNQYKIPVDRNKIPVCRNKIAVYRFKMWEKLKWQGLKAAWEVF